MSLCLIAKLPLAIWVIVERQTKKVFVRTAVNVKSKKEKTMT